MVMTTETEQFTLEDFMKNPPENMEWVDQKLVEKTGMTLRHSEIQSRLSRYWGNYKTESGQGGEVYVEMPCRTQKQGRRPDVSYLTPELLERYRNEPTLPQSPPLVAEIASPTDVAEELFAKAQEYLDSNCQEVWLVFPEGRRILIVTENQTLAFQSGDTVSSQVVLEGFKITLDELLG
ncbi:Uma2 family endonuclease [Laspinema olomoucense]|uniref:Uma2 family endonuclease n=1 Tax=Laspinema olomoucense D3b TaxID=2953688 RepID=A0ABT2NC92_9CYAN|nr:Uma2 family endonuclease [Laspinema sp. D3b]MCT7980314.1 Uma2 family endonuclease [Laspinema sp. D3b]